MTFVELASAFEALVRDALPLTAVRQRPERVGFMITPWLQTPVPFFSLTLALLYHRRGYQVSLFYDDQDFTPSALTPTEHLWIRKILALLDPYIPHHKVSELPAAEIDPGAPERIAKLARVNTIWRRRSSVGVDGEAERIDGYRRTLLSNYPRILTAYRMLRFHHMVCPGGIWGNSCLYLLAGKVGGVRTATYDCGDGRLFVGADNVASYFMDDVAAYHRVMNEFPAAAVDQICQLAQEEFMRRQGGNDKHSYQVVAGGNHVPQGSCDALFPLSIDWDAPGLGRNRFFDSPAEWVRDTVGTILANTKATVVVRQHPYNRFLNSADGWEQFTLEQVSPKDRHRFRFIRAEEELNTYDLLPAARVVLPYVSTFGIEAAFLGKQVVMESDSHYSSLPFVTQADSREDYYAKVIEALDRPAESVSPEKTRAALVYYYIVQQAKYAFSDFTPLPNDAAKWIQWGLSGIESHPVVRTVVDSISTATPIAWINLKEKFKLA